MLRGGEEPGVDGSGEDARHLLRIAECLLAAMYGDGAKATSVVDDYEARRLVSRHTGLVMLLDGDVDAVGKLHHDDFGCRQQVIHSVIEHFLRLALAQPEVDARVLLEEPAQVMLAIFPVMRGELMLVLDEKMSKSCHKVIQVLIIVFSSTFPTLGIRPRLLPTKLHNYLGFRKEKGEKNKRQ